MPRLLLYVAVVVLVLILLPVCAAHAASNGKVADSPNCFALQERDAQRNCVAQFGSTGLVLYTFWFEALILVTGFVVSAAILIPNPPRGVLPWVLGIFGGFGLFAFTAWQTEYFQLGEYAEAVSLGVILAPVFPYMSLMRVVGLSPLIFTSAMPYVYCAMLLPMSLIWALFAVLRPPRTGIAVGAVLAASSVVGAWSIWP